MTDLLIHLPDDALLALRQQTDDDMARALLLAAAVKYYEIGHLSAGAAAHLAGLSKPYFLSRLADFGVPALDLTEEEFDGETRLA